MSHPGASTFFRLRKLPYARVLFVPAPGFHWSTGFFVSWSALLPLVSRAADRSWGAAPPRALPLSLPPPAHPSGHPPARPFPGVREALGYHLLQPRGAEGSGGGDRLRPAATRRLRGGSERGEAAGPGGRVHGPAVAGWRLCGQAAGTVRSVRARGRGPARRCLGAPCSAAPSCEGGPVRIPASARPPSPPGERSGLRPRPGCEAAADGGMPWRPR